ncbi:MAG: hypothetical protein AAF735_03565 [Myxococcota bacterium]
MPRWNVDLAGVWPALGGWRSVYALRRPGPTWVGRCGFLIDVSSPGASCLSGCLDGVGRRDLRVFRNRWGRVLVGLVRIAQRVAIDQPGHV